MFTPVRKNILRWGTPDPEGDWIMYGHLIFDEEKLVMIDPPLVPGLLDAVSRIGKLDAVILTTLDHTRGSRYIIMKTGAELYIPDQVTSLSVDPDNVLKQKDIRNFHRYSKEGLFGLKPFRITAKGREGEEVPWLDEFAFLTDRKELIVGDIAIGTPEGDLILSPEWFPHDPPHPPHPPAFRELDRIVKETGAETLLAPHGCNVYGNLGELMLQKAHKK